MLYDLKLFDPSRHQQATGQPNGQILENLLHVHQAIRTASRPVQLWIRSPLIPGATDDDENLLALGAWIARHLGDSVSRWELCAFNNLCRDQYTRLGMSWKYAATPLMTAAELARCQRAAQASGVAPEIVMATGATRPAEQARRNAEIREEKS